MSYDVPMSRVALGAATAIVTTLVVVAPVEPGAATRARSCSRPPGLPKVFAPRVDNEYFPLRPGMTLSANLLLERRRLWEVFLDPVLRALKQ